jgi:hypothetical protein
VVAAILSTVLAGGAAQHEHLRLPLRRRDGEGALSLAHGSVGRGDVAAIYVLAGGAVWSQVD